MPLKYIFIFYIYYIHNGSSNSFHPKCAFLIKEFENVSCMCVPILFSFVFWNKSSLFNLEKIWWMTSNDKLLRKSDSKQVETMNVSSNSSLQCIVWICIHIFQKCCNFFFNIVPILYFIRKYLEKILCNLLNSYLKVEINCDLLRKSLMVMKFLWPLKCCKTIFFNTIPILYFKISVLY